MEFGALSTKYRVPVTLKGGPQQVEVKELPKHKKNADVGFKKTVFSSSILVEQEDAASFEDNEEVTLSADFHCRRLKLSVIKITLMDWGNAIIRTKSLGPSGDVTAIEADIFLEGDFKKTKKKVTWLPANSPLVDVTLLDYDYIITKKKLEEEDDVADFVTPQTEFRVEAHADANVVELKQGDIIQFERKGYHILDKVRGDFVKGDLHLDFISIPDGRAGGVASKAGAIPVDPSAAPAAKKPTTGGWGNSAPSGAQAPVKAPSPDGKVMLSEELQGFKIPVTTTMYKADPVAGDAQAKADTKMYKVDSVYDWSA